MQNKMKPTVAIFDFACCEGCQLQFINMEEDLLRLLNLVEPVAWREAMSDEADSYDIAFVEGAITRAEDAERLRLIRGRAKILVALGACATIGGVNRLKDNLPAGEAAAAVYGAQGAMPHLASDKTRAADEIVKVDYKIHGCPVDPAELAAFVRALVAGRRPFTPNYPVCVECKQRGIVCRYEYNEVCLGPLVRAGCGARCPAGGAWCFGCRGYVDEPNVNAAFDVMRQYGKTVDDLKARLELFAGREVRQDAQGKR